MRGAGIEITHAAAPEQMRIYAIGDVHGRFDLLQQMHQLIAAEIMRDQPADWRVIHLGDFIDRGPQSAETLDCLAKLTMPDPRYIALMGNHDEGMLDFLDDPTSSQIFVDFGGRETAASYGVTLDASSRHALFESHRELLSALPERHIIFLRSLQRSISFGDYFFCHAGVRPSISLDQQDPHDLIAFATGQLTAIVLDGREKRFLTAEADDG